MNGNSRPKLEARGLDRRVCGAFTLVELVVVLALMSLLMAILAPGLALARRKSQGAHCISNLRQIGYAIENYRADNEDIIPASLTAGLDPAQLRAALRAESSVLPTAWAASGGDNPASLAEYCGDPTILVCPSRCDTPLMSYGLNGQVVGVVNRFRHIPDPSRTPLIFDSLKDMGYNYSDLDPRHVRAANILFADTHIEQRFFDSLYQFAAAVPLPGVTAGQKDNFTLDGGVVTVHSNLTAEIIVLGAAFQNGIGGSRIPVSAFYRVNDGQAERIASDAYYGGSVTVQNLAPGDTITIRGARTDNGQGYESDDGTGHVWSLLRGSVVPNVAGFDGQPDIEAFVQGYIGTDGRVNIGDQSVIYLFELSGSINYQRDSSADFQDLVVLINFSESSEGGGGGGGSSKTAAIDVRISGSPWDSVAVELRENNTVMGSMTMARRPGNPNEQTQTLGTFTVSPATKTYTMRFVLSTQNYGGGNPVWVRVNGGNWNKVCTVNRPHPESITDITGLLN